MKSNKCFYCLNKGEGVAADKGYHYPCTKGIENEGLQDISKCEKYSPCNGFQIGGYYTHMHFDQESISIYLSFHVIRYIYPDRLSPPFYI